MPNSWLVTFPYRRENPIFRMRTDLPERVVVDRARLRVRKLVKWAIPVVSNEMSHDTNFVQTFLWRSEEHTSELQSLMRISYAVFCLNKKIKKNKIHTSIHHKF